ncbi:ferredoxin--NADP reductase [Adhaeribacter radiodurans]|uniref:Ferredoxin--NADP reductase n=1 Tax=Adhaeribacter radiodurans TaxID=2745197 RepID=A0A7L7L8Q4_9BACT|nr:ferredoxin--NADP reductase [Adhaeribacter radiodurans]QMU29188.1 ferredoxin--NADP reductase [Adhaeribacter radiodurans]
MSQPNLFLKVVAITSETSDAITIHLEHPDKTAIPYQAGQFLTLIVPINGKKERRAYSLCSSPSEQPRLSVTVKRVAGGLLSNYLLNKLKVGDTLEVLAPMGNFNFVPDATFSRTIVLIGAGSGITPLMSIAKSVLQQELNSRVLLIYGNRDESSVIFKEQLKDLESQNPDRFRVTHIYSQSSDSTSAKSSGSFLSKLFGKSKNKEVSTVIPEEALAYYTGRLNQTMLIKILENLQVLDLPETYYYMCGPEGFMQEAKAALQILHVPATQVFKESFVSSGHNAADAGAGITLVVGEPNEIQDQIVTIIYEGSEYKVEVPQSETILEAALNQDIDLPFSCQAGLCTACRGKCLSGKVHLDEREGLSDAEMAEGYVLTCVGHPLTNDVIIEIS